MNLIFHIIAGFSVLALCFYLLRLQKQKKLLLQIINFERGETQVKVVVDWPLKYLKKLVTALDIELIDEISSNEISPKKINTYEIFKVLLYLSVFKIELKNGDEFKVFLYIKNYKNDQNHLIDNFSEALGVRCQVKS